MDFAGAIKSGLVNWNKFSGTASKSEYWYFYLFTWILGQVVNLVDLIVQPNLRSNAADGTEIPTLNQLIGMIPVPSLIVALVILVPQLAVTYRRIQDGGRPGWLAFLQLVPLALAGVMLATMFSSWNKILTNSDAGAALTILGLALLTLAAALAWLVLWLVWTLAPTKTAEQGNKYAN